MTIEGDGIVIPKTRISTIKSWIKVLSISYIALTAVLLLLGFLVCPFIIIFLYIPLAGVAMIALDVLFWMYIHERFKTKKETSLKLLLPHKNILSGLIITIILCLSFNFIVNVINMIKPLPYSNLAISSAYIVLAGLTLLATVIFIIGTSSEEIEKEANISAILFACYIVLTIPYLIGLYYRFIDMIVPVTLLLYSILGVAITLVFYILHKMFSSKVLLLILGYGWVFAILSIFNYLRFFIGFGYRIISLVNGSLTSLCIIGTIVALIPFLQKLLRIRKRPLELQTN